MKKALIFQGGWPGHKPAEFSEIFAEILREIDIEPVVRDSQEPLTDLDLLESLSLVVPVWTMGELVKEASQTLSKAVQLGTGLAGTHGGMGDAFRKDCRFQFMVGGQFVAHQPKHWDYTVRIQKNNDSVVAGLEDFTYHSEQYYMHTDPSNDVLADTVFETKDKEWAPWVDGTVMPVVWKRQHGEGRVFYNALGHAPEEFDRFPQAREITKRGFAWAAGID